MKAKELIKVLQQHPEWEVCYREVGYASGIAPLKREAIEAYNSEWRECLRQTKLKPDTFLITTPR